MDNDVVPKFDHPWSSPYQPYEYKGRNTVYSQFKTKSPFSLGEEWMPEDRNINSTYVDMIKTGQRLPQQDKIRICNAYRLEPMNSFGSATGEEDNENGDTESSNETAKKVGIAIAVIFVVLAVILLIFWALRNNKMKQTKTVETSESKFVGQDFQSVPSNEEEFFF